MPRPALRRPAPRPPGATPQGEETRRTLYRVATDLFAARGYEDTTLREIAAAAGVSPGLLYRYFPSKRAVVLALYDELSREFEERARHLPAGRWRDRFVAALEASLEVLRPHRGTLVALVPTLVGGRDESLLAPATAFSRERVQGAFVALCATTQQQLDALRLRCVARRQRQVRVGSQCLGVQVSH